MRTFRYHRVDVFTEEPLGGNPLAVFPDAEGLTDREMQRIAREMNLSETVFCFPSPEAGVSVRLRIFTVDRELPLAGHPVIGTHFALAVTGRYDLQPEVTMVTAQLMTGTFAAEIQCVDRKVRQVLMTQRNPWLGPVFPYVEKLAAALGLHVEVLCAADLPVRVVDTGVPWLIIPLNDLRTLRRLEPNPVLCREVAELAGTDMFYAFTQDTEDPTCAVRARHVWFGTATPGEDPVTGSAAGCLASYLVDESVILAAPTAEVQIEQGAEVGRPGKILALVDTDGEDITRVRVGGRAVYLGDGELRLPDSQLL